MRNSYEIIAYEIATAKVKATRILLAELVHEGMIGDKQAAALANTGKEKLLRKIHDRLIHHYSKNGSGFFIINPEILKEKLMCCNECEKYKPKYRAVEEKKFKVRRCDEKCVDFIALKVDNVQRLLKIQGYKRTTAYMTKRGKDKTKFPEEVTNWTNSVFVKYYFYLHNQYTPYVLPPSGRLVKNCISKLVKVAKTKYDNYQLIIKKYLEREFERASERKEGVAVRSLTYSTTFERLKHIEVQNVCLKYDIRCSFCDTMGRCLLDDEVAECTKAIRMKMLRKHN